MAEQYTAEWPRSPCEICGRQAFPGVPLCSSCWTVRQLLENHVATLLRTNATAAPKLRELLERALQTKPEPPEAA